MKRINAAVIGVGLMGSLYARILAQLPETELAAVCGRTEAHTEAVAAELKVPGYARKKYSKMFEEHPEIEVVIVATPDNDHLEPLKACIEAGAQICLEKPLAVDIGEAEQMVRLTRESNTTLMMCHTLRFDPRYVSMREAVEQGEIGPVTHIYARRNIPASRVRRVGGRVNSAFWIGVHDIDMMHWVTDSHVVFVTAQKAEGVLSEDLGVEDCILSLLSFENGVVASLENSWVSPLVEGRPMSAQFEVRGPGGVIEVTAHEQGIGIYQEGKSIHPDTVYSPTLHGRITGVYRDQIAHFIECVATGMEPVVTVEDGFRAVIVADALTRSAAEGRMICL